MSEHPKHLKVLYYLWLICLAWSPTLERYISFANRGCFGANNYVITTCITDLSMNIVERICASTRMSQFRRENHLSLLGTSWKQSFGCIVEASFPRESVSLPILPNCVTAVSARLKRQGKENHISLIPGAAWEPKVVVASHFRAWPGLELKPLKVLVTSTHGLRFDLVGVQVEIRKFAYWMTAFTLKGELHIAMNIVSGGSEKGYFIIIE